MAMPIRSPNRKTQRCRRDEAVATFGAPLSARPVEGRLRPLPVRARHHLLFGAVSAPLTRNFGHERRTCGRGRSFCVLPACRHSGRWGARAACPCPTGGGRGRRRRSGPERLAASSRSTLSPPQRSFTWRHCHSAERNLDQGRPREGQNHEDLPTPIIDSACAVRECAERRPVGVHGRRR
jgi:hypothetical protein